MKLLLAAIVAITVSLNYLLSCFAVAEYVPADSLLGEQRAANRAFWEKDFKTAGDIVQKLLLTPNQSRDFKARCLVNLAICQAQLDDWDAARKNSLAAMKIAKPNSLTSADAFFTYARCQYLDGKIDNALRNYQKALNTVISLEGDWNVDLAPLYEGLAGCYFSKKDYLHAEPYYKKVAQLDFLHYGLDDTRYAWSLLSLTAVEQHLGHKDLAALMYKKVFWNFRHQNELRIINENSAEPDQEKLIETLRQQLYGTTGAYDDRNLTLDCIKKGIPLTILNNHPKREQIFANWFKERVGREQAPGLAFFDPTKKLKALIVTVHGLGLHHGAFTPFAQQIQHEGFGVISFDVRGFGSYRNDEVYQRLDLPAAMHDLKRILTALRADYPKTPIILLGESMGGAMVLRLAALAPDLVHAVISSVPSGSRYESKSTILSIGLKLLRDKYEQFDIGSKVVKQATLKPGLRDMWEGDPNMRMKLSPSELISFQKFMSQNVKFAAKIEHTPVIIFQGYSDNLVKPMGTLAIYQAITNRDKDLLFAGRAEHLIFEEGQFDPDIYKEVVAWINKHISPEEVD